MLYLLPSPIGNLADVTLRVLEVLQKSDVFLCEDTRVTKKLLSLLEEKRLLSPKERIFFPFHTHNQEKFLTETSPCFFEQEVAFMSDAGMPCISDPGSLLVQYAQKNHIVYEVLPAGSAVTLAYAYSGFGDGGFIFDGFLPHKSNERKSRLSYWKEHLEGLSLIVFESPHRLLESLQDIACIDLECEIFLIKEMTKKFTQFYKGNIQSVLEQIKGKNTQGEWVFVLKFSSANQEERLGSCEIMAMDLPPKIKAKLLSKILKESPKILYERELGREK